MHVLGFMLLTILRSFLPCAIPADGRISSVQDSLGGLVESFYDADNRLSARVFRAHLGDTFSHWVYLTYNQASQLRSIVRQTQGPVNGWFHVRSELTYDSGGRLDEIKHFNHQDAVIADYLYDHDSGGRLTSATENGQGRAFGYDATNQLLTAGADAYSFDANGNRTMPGYETGEQNKLLTDGAWNYEYDLEGNILIKTNAATGEHWSYSYDNANHMTVAEFFDANFNSLLLVEFRYDVFGNRVAKIVTSGTSAPVTTRYAYQGPDVWAELDAGNNLVMRYLRGDQPNQLLARIDAADALTWYLTDQLGSVRDFAGLVGNVYNHLDYDAFGQLINETAPGQGGTFRYAGYQWDSETGLYYVKARYYDPAIGRFVSQDPLGLGPDSNPYRYVKNGPTNATDPTGLAPTEEKSAYEKGFQDGRASSESARLFNFTASDFMQQFAGKSNDWQFPTETLRESYRQGFRDGLGIADTPKKSTNAAAVPKFFDVSGLGFLAKPVSPSARDYEVWAKQNYGDVASAPTPFILWANQVTKLPPQSSFFTNLVIGAPQLFEPTAIVAGAVHDVAEVREILADPQRYNRPGINREVQANMIGTLIQLYLPFAAPEASAVRGLAKLEGRALAKLESGAAAARKIAPKPKEIQFAGLGPQEFMADVSHLTGRTAQARNRAIQAVIAEDFAGLDLIQVPQYSPIARTGIAANGEGTQIGTAMFSSRARLRDTIVHEELHHRWWDRGILEAHHDYREAGRIVKVSTDAKFYATVERYKKWKGWEYNQEFIDRWNATRPIGGN